MINPIGRCIDSGNVRRTVEIAFRNPDLEEYIDLKNCKKIPHRAPFSNNSVFAYVGMDYDKICQRILDNGEPGFT